jgi:pyruvate-ferredoxin/flavodoxin oxidoreductase
VGRHPEAIEGNEAAARVAYPLSEVIAIYPITPSSPMGELADAWAASGRTNLWGAVPTIVEMQSEGGAAGAMHGALTTGSLATTFTSSQGLLLMIPNMYKIAGELTPAVIHVAARTLATHALSIFGDHSDVMAARSTGFALLASSSVQEAMDLALVAHAATLQSRIPFLHFFDGFRTSHEIQKIEVLDDADLRAVIDEPSVEAFRGRGLSPDRPALRGTAQNPDVFFQAREAANPFYLACPDIVQAAMDRLGARTGRLYRLFDYVGSPEADRLIVMMGSGAGAVEEAVEELNRRGERVGLVKVRLFRPFAVSDFLRALPGTVRSIAVLDRCKEPGSTGEPLYLDVLAALAEGVDAAPQGAGRPLVIGGRYGLASKEFTPAMAASIFAELRKDRPKNHFTIGIVDDVSGTSLPWDRTFTTEPPGTVRAVFYGLGSDGTVGANKNTIKIIAENTDNFAQGYFVYDSKKSGSTTVSHLRFGKRPIRSTYLIDRADFIGCHQESFLETLDVLGLAGEGAALLVNTSIPPEDLWARLPREMQTTILEKKIRLFAIDAYAVAQEAGLGRLINTVMQTCFFALSRVLPLEAALAAVRDSIKKTYGRKSEQIVGMNLRAVDRSLEHLHEVPIPTAAGETSAPRRAPMPPEAPDFVRRVLGEIAAGRGDLLPVSALPVDGTFPTGTARWEKRNIALEIPAWDAAWCIQCNKCALVCPHTAIRVKAYPATALSDAPVAFKSVDWKGAEFPPGTKYSVQVAAEDCTGCGLCVEACPAHNKTETRLKAINMTPQTPLRDQERTNLEYFLALPEADRTIVHLDTVKGSQLLEPLFEYSGACAGCGETPYLKLLTQLFGDRLLVANATGCSSIYGGNLPTTPWCASLEGRGPAWSNSLFEDNAEFGLGFRLSLDARRDRAARLLESLKDRAADQSSEAALQAQRGRVAELRRRLGGLDVPAARQLADAADDLVKRSVWIVGGDGWAYDIGYGGLDHVLASTRDVNVLVLDTEVYSNTGGQASKATPRAAVAKFAAGGKTTPRKDLVSLALEYGHVYVARVAMGASDAQTLKAFLEAEAYPGPSLIVAYSHCIAHGINMRLGMQQQKLAVDSGYWPLLRYHPGETGHGPGELKLDSRPPRIPLRDYAYRETRYRVLAATRPDEARRLLDEAQRDVEERFRKLQERERAGAATVAAAREGRS